MYGILYTSKGQRTKKGERKLSKIKTIKLQPGETVILKTDEAAQVVEPGRPKTKRNTAKAREWEKEKYKRYVFLIDKNTAEAFEEAIGEIRPLDWFREVIKIAIEARKKPEQHATGSVMRNTRPKTKKPPPPQEMIEKWRQMRNEGQPLRKIAKSPEGGGYTKSTIDVHTK